MEKKNMRIFFNALILIPMIVVLLIQGLVGNDIAGAVMVVAIVIAFNKMLDGVK